MQCKHNWVTVIIALHDTMVATILIARRRRFVLLRPRCGSLLQTRARTEQEETRLETQISHTNVPKGDDCLTIKNINQSSIM
mmetsp:Transcript_18076/g.39402  ORF Transcript_18076/g.39402 Transcript_18076/m.39402 type:complete len:82 (+) Transcript_18076:207-452(+)